MYFKTDSIHRNRQSCKIIWLTHTCKSTEKCAWVNPSNLPSKVRFTFKCLFPVVFYKAEKFFFFLIFFIIFFIIYPSICFIRTMVAAGRTSKLNSLNPKPTNIATLSTPGKREDITEQHRETIFPFNPSTCCYQQEMFSAAITTCTNPQLFRTHKTSAYSSAFCFPLGQVKRCITQM